MAAGVSKRTREGSRSTGRAASVNDLWKLHRELIRWFLAYLESPDPKSGAVIAEMVRFLSENNVRVDGRAERELKTHVEVLAGLTVPFPSTTAQ